MLEKMGGQISDKGAREWDELRRAPSAVEALFFARRFPCPACKIQHLTEKSPVGRDFRCNTGLVGV